MNLAIGAMTVLLGWMQVSCSSLIDGVLDGQDHDDAVDRYQRRGYSEEKAEKRVFEDEFFADMESRRFQEPPKKVEYILKVHEDEY